MFYKVQPTQKASHDRTEAHTIARKTYGAAAAGQKTREKKSNVSGKSHQRSRDRSSEGFGRNCLLAIQRARFCLSFNTAFHVWDFRNKNVSRLLMRCWGAAIIDGTEVALFGC